MSLVRKQHVERLIVRAKVELGNDDHDFAWRLLEEAHIFAQPYPGLHLCVHGEMLLLAIKEKNFFEFFGQILRSFLAVPASVFRKYPTGNIGRSSVSMFLPMKLSKKIEKKLQELDRLEKQRIENGGVLNKNQRQHPLTRG